MIYNYKGKQPKIAKSAFIADNVTITGDVTVGEETNIWFNTSIRGDISPTTIGNKVNIQDNCVLHQSIDTPLIIEDQVTIGHQVILHGCTVKKKALIGMGSIILDNAVIGEGALIGAGSLVSQGKTIPPYTLAYGRPAKVIRELTEEEKIEMLRNCAEYVEKGKYYKAMQTKVKKD